MQPEDLEKIGLNKNEAKVYLGLLQRGQATAAELVRIVGVHRNIVYDNIEKLMEKGLVSSIVKDTKRVFIAQDPTSIIDFLEEKKQNIQKNISQANQFIPEITAILSQAKTPPKAELFSGIKGVKKVLSNVLASKEYWIIGVSNASVKVLGTTYWKNFNIKVKDKKIQEHLLLNADFKDAVALNSSKSQIRKLPAELIQVTEFIMYSDKVAIFIYTDPPIAIEIADKDLFQTYLKQFEFLWSIAKR